MSLQRIRRAWGYLSRNGVDPRTVRLATDGVSLFQISREDDAIIDVLREGQLAFFARLDEITSNVEEDTTLFELDRDKFLSVLRNTQEEVVRHIEAASG